MILWQCTPAVTGALIKTDCFLPSWDCNWLLFETQHCVWLAQLAMRQTRRGFIKIQLMACASGKELLVSLVCALQYPRCDSYCHGIIQDKGSHTPKWTNENASCLFTSAEQHSENVNCCVTCGNQYYMSQSGCYDKSLSLSGYYGISGTSIPLQYQTNFCIEEHSDLLIAYCIKRNKSIVAE